MSIKTLFTPGPWQFEQHGNDHNLWGANRQRVLTITNGVIPMNADAALIKAAPELFNEVMSLRESLNEVLMRWRMADESYHEAIGRKAEPVAAETQTHKRAEAAMKRSLEVLAECFP